MLYLLQVYYLVWIECLVQEAVEWVKLQEIGSDSRLDCEVGEISSRFMKYLALHYKLLVIQLTFNLAFSLR